MKLHPYFVPGGVYLRTETGELIGRRDKPGEPFATLEEARGKADWLAMTLQYQQAQRQRDLVAMSRSIASGDGNTNNAVSAVENPQTSQVQSLNDRGVNYE